MKKLPILFVFAATCQLCWAQQQSPWRHGVSLEALGPGAYLAVNYELKLQRVENMFTTFRLGVGFTDTRSVAIPHGVFFNFGKRRNFFEAGVWGSAGETAFGAADRPASFYFVAPSLGYRRQYDNLFFRVTLCGRMPIEDYFDLILTAGVGIGYSFGRR